MSCRILVVEDEVVVAEDLKDTLESLGHNVLRVTDNGSGAIRLAKILLPDIIFMDIKLKGKLDGIETAQLIEGVSEKKISFIFTTSYPMKYYESAKLREQPMYIQKPYTMQKIEDAIRRSHLSV